MCNKFQKHARINTKQVKYISHIYFISEQVLFKLVYGTAGRTENIVIHNAENIKKLLFRFWGNIRGLAQRFLHGNVDTTVK